MNFLLKRFGVFFLCLTLSGGQLFAALSATSVFEVRTPGSDTTCSGGFNPGNSNMATDLAATVATGNSPVVTSASYTFVAGDVGAWLYVKSGTNWTAGWYPIASVSAGAATLTASIGSAVSATYVINTVAGCATTTSPTGGTWSVDYSQQAAAKFAYTDAVIDGTTNTKFTSAANPIGKNCVGNLVNFTSGTGFTVQLVEIVSTSTITATCDKSLGTLSSTGGNGYLGGAFASPGIAASSAVVGNRIWLKNGTYVISSSTSNIAGGRIAIPATGFSNTLTTLLVGYTSVRGDYSTRPLIRAANTTDGDGSTLTGTTLLTFNNTGAALWNVDLSARSTNTTLKGVSCTATCYIINSKLSGFTNNAASGDAILKHLEVSGCFTQVALFNIRAIDKSVIKNNGAGGAAITNQGRISHTLIVGNTGVGATFNGFSGYADNCTFANNTSDGLGFTGGVGEVTNCVFYGNSGYGINAVGGSVTVMPIARSCAFGSNTSGKYTALSATSIGEITLTADPFTNAAAGDFSLNTTAGGGAACRAAGVPGIFPGGLSTGYLDIGAVQHQDSGGSGVALPPTMRGGFSN